MTTENDPKRVIRRLNMIGFALMVLLFGGAGGWSMTSELSGAVVASGTVVVESNVKRVQHQGGGIIDQILVKDGSIVEEGQLLIRLDDTVPKSTLGVLQSQLDELIARQARLFSERNGSEDLAFPEELTLRRPELAVSAALLGEQKLFESRRRSRDGQKAQLNERVAQTEQEVSGLQGQLKSNGNELEFVRQELVGARDLYEKQLATIMRYTQLQRDQARLQGEQSKLISEIARARSKISESNLQIIQVDSDFSTEVLKDLREVQGKIAELRERAVAATDQLRRIEIRAPQAGIVYQLAFHNLECVIKDGETIMQIVPNADSLVVEAKVTPSDIDQIEVGAPTHLRIVAGNQRTVPELAGQVVTVSPDVTHENTSAATQQQSQPFYLVRVSLPSDQLRRLAELRVVPGMSAEVFIQTQERTPMQYLLKPLREQVARAFRER
jgi:HlyD family secretion protein